MILAYPSNWKFLTSKILSTNHKTADQLKNKVVIVMPSIEKNGKIIKISSSPFYDRSPKIQKKLKWSRLSGRLAYESTLVRQDEVLCFSWYLVNL